MSTLLSCLEGQECLSHVASIDMDGGLAFLYLGAVESSDSPLSMSLVLTPLQLEDGWISLYHQGEAEVEGLVCSPLIQ